jgi:hypothetical protein
MAFPDGRAGWWIKGDTRNELTRAMNEAGARQGPPEAGAIIDVTFNGERPIPNRSPAMILAVRYTAPAAQGAAMLVPAPAPQTQPQPPAPAPQTQPQPPAYPPQPQPTVGQPAAPVAYAPPAPAPAPAPQAYAPPVQAPPAPAPAPYQGQPAAPNGAQPGPAALPPEQQALVNTLYGAGGAPAPAPAPAPQPAPQG